MIFTRILSAEYEYGRQTGSDYDFLNRSPRGDVENVRQLIEDWFERFPASEKDRLSSALRSKDNITHQSAFFELYCHELLLRHGFVVTAHNPESNSRAKDFRAQLGPSTVDLEATVCTDADSLSTQSKLLSTIIDYVNEHAFVSGFRYHFEVHRRGTELPRMKRLSAEIADFARSFNRKELREALEKVNFQNIPTRDFTDGEWTFEIGLIPRPHDETASIASKRSIGIGPTTGGVLHHDSALRNTLDRKAKHYTQHDHPYIIAVDTIFEMSMRNDDDIDVLQALLGTEQVEFRSGFTNPRATRKPDGIWVGPRGARNRNVSAILHVNQMKSWNICAAPIKMYLNPWAANPLEHQVFRVEKRIWNLSTGEPTDVKGEAPSVLFGLDSRWPEP